MWALLREIRLLLLLDKKIEQATDGSLASENWALNMEICDYINASTDGPRDAVKAIRKRLQQNAGKNYTTVMYTLTVLETCVKNCGKQLHILICNKEFIQDLIKLIGPKNDPPTAVQEKVLSLIQCWADAFQHQPELAGVVSMYQELRSKGVQFPMTDLDTMAPIFTPQRSVPEDVVDGVNTGAGDASPQRAPASPQPRPARDTPPSSMVHLSPSQVNKLHSDLAVVQGNMVVMGDMLNEMTASQGGQHHPNDLELLQELHSTLHAMQTRLVDLIGKISDDSLTGELLRVNDELNSLMLRHQRFSKNRAAAPSAVLAAAMGPPQAAALPGDSLIDLSDGTPALAALTLSEGQPKPAAGTDKDEFDMFAQSRNLTYESTKNGSSSYADNIEPGQVNVGLAALSQSRPTTGQPQGPNDSDRDFDEIAAWLSAEEASGLTAAEPQESVTSSDFDKFLAERAAAAESTPTAAASQTVRQRQPKKDEDGMFAL